MKYILSPLFFLALLIFSVPTLAQEGLPKQMEWFAALGVVITLVWLYLEILRLLSKLRDN